MKSLKSVVVIFLLVITIPAPSQNNYPDKVPKRYSFEAGYTNITSSGFGDHAKQGITAGFDYAWQLTGLTGKKPRIFISVPIFYTYFLAGQDSSMAMLTYGWRVRHSLVKDKPVIPYLGYHLLLNQMKIFHREGAIMGHQTKFELGLDFIKDRKAFPFIQVEYSMTRFPSLDNEKSRWVHAIGIKSGMRF